MIRADVAVRVWVRAGLIVLGCAVGCDGEGDPVGSNRGGGGGEIRGTVSRQKTGAGVPNAIVVVSQGGLVVGTAYSDGTGAFSVDGVPEGLLTVSLTGLEIAGLDPRFDALEPPSQQVTVSGAVSDVVFAVVGLVPPRISGEVTCGGAPVPGVRIRVIGGSSDAEVFTGPQGRFSAGDLFPGSYAVFPDGAPCALDPAFGAVTLLPGQVGAADFSG